ncbi:hypothetical protein MADP09_00154 [Mycoplasma anatis]|uniref:MAG5620 family putative phospho-sugar mutase n=1 Tax=Mycoplasmopsis anatis TaxID=171279 RepID=UPI001C4F8A1A|nr:hypothetical protein [Mycoplasmopsis anatis]MBW0597316.1 hypothetical protein [Mycoplasmopsis anatis]
MTKEYYQKKWLNFYTSNEYMQNKVNIVFNNWELNKESFLKSPEVTNKGIKFSNDFGYSYFCEFSVEIIIMIFCTMLKPNMKIGLGFDIETPEQIRKNVLNLFAQQGVQVYVFEKNSPCSETNLRDLLKIDRKLNGGIYFDYDQIEESWYIKFLDVEGVLVPIKIQQKLVDSLSELNLSLGNYLNLNNSINVSYDKVFENSFSKHKLFNFLQVDDFFSNLKIEYAIQNEIFEKKFNTVTKLLNLNTTNSKVMMLNHNISLLKSKFKSNDERSDLLVLVNKKNQLKIYNKVSGKLIEIENDLIAFLYIDFMIGYWRNAKIDNKLVVLPLNAKKYVINLLESYSINYAYENQIHNERDVLFSYNQGLFSTGVNDGFNYDNLKFLFFYIYMTNEYKIKGDFINYKTNQLLNVYNLHLYDQIKISFDKIFLKKMDLIFSVGQKFTKTQEIVKIIKHNYESYGYFYLYTIILSDDSRVIYLYDIDDAKMIINVEFMNNMNKMKVQNKIKFEELKNKATDAVKFAKKF